MPAPAPAPAPPPSVFLLYKSSPGVARPLSCGLLFWTPFFLLFFSPLPKSHLNEVWFELDSIPLFPSLCACSLPQRIPPVHLAPASLATAIGTRAPVEQPGMWTDFACMCPRRAHMHLSVPPAGLALVRFPALQLGGPRKAPGDECAVLDVQVPGGRAIGLTTLSPPPPHQAPEASPTPP
ncbi:hypothetical protein FJTKL_01637 [Diaporthe vaccinii]|uniref:Uncharacterized protein n=1 Tax=Diaporthe vaccinii TaxID=105482 RepID=A0ABR4DZV5_9PEZI